MARSANGRMADRKSVAIGLVPVPACTTGRSADWNFPEQNPIGETLSRRPAAWRQRAGEPARAPFRLTGPRRKKGRVIRELPGTMSTEKFYPSVAKMQKKRMTTPNVWASFRPQKRQGVQILAKFAVKSWEDQILGARSRCHRKRIRITRYLKNKASSLVFFCFSAV